MTNARMGTLGWEMEQFEKNIKAARQISRNAVYRIVLLSSAIVGFSVSIFSIPSLQENINLFLVRWSWYAFLVVIIFGAFSLLFEGRIRYAATWKGRQTSIWADSLKDYTGYENFLAYLIVLVTLLYPANLIFNKVQADKEKAAFQQKVNGLVVHRLARLVHSIVVLETLVFVFLWQGLCCSLSPLWSECRSPITTAAICSLNTRVEVRFWGRPF